MRRLVFAVLSVFLFLPPATALAAQDATPGAGGLFGDLGLPELDITITADGYEGIPESIEAGRYLVTVTASADTADNGGGGVSFIQPAGMTGQEFIDFLTQLMAPPDVSGAASPPAGNLDQAPPEFFYQSLIAGGVYAMPGQTAQVVLDLPPGEWVAWGDDPTAPQAPVAFTATGEMPADLPEPESSATLTMEEYSIEVTEGEIVPGSQVLRVHNAGEQPHFVFGVNGPEGMTRDDVEAILNAEMTGTPAATDINPETDFQDVFGTATQSGGTTQWIAVEDVPAGPLLLICFFPDEADGMPHALHGMYNVVEVQ